MDRIPVFLDREEVGRVGAMIDCSYIGMTLANDEWQGYLCHIPLKDIREKGNCQGFIGLRDEAPEFYKICRVDFKE